MPLALITGGARRIGAHIALTLAEHGFDIALHVNRSQADGAEILDQIREKGVRAELFELDLNRIDEIETLFNRITDTMGNVDLAVNNASMFSYDTADDFNVEIAQEHFRVNLLAPAKITQCVASSNSSNALVVNMLDNKLFSMNPDFFSYTLSKAGLKSATEMMAMHYAGRLRVNAIAPGVTLRSGDQTEENFEKSWRMSLSGVGATPDDIANTILHMWNTPSINAEIIVLDGGQRLMGLDRDVAFLND